MKNLSIYAIVDKDYIGSNQRVIKITRQLINAGIDIIQLRAKTATGREFVRIAESIKKLCIAGHVPLIINDRVDVAMIINADGVHLGQDDVPVGSIRKIFKNKIIGKSTHTLKQAITAEREGVDYIGVGPVFKTQLKPQAKAVGLNLISKVDQQIKIPYFVIGGINLKTLKCAVDAGANRCAICRGLINTKNKKSDIAQLRRILSKNENIN
ncbi:MAG: thiamine phosphate synthase [Candidatus Omnitrophota bacterium]